MKSFKIVTVFFFLPFCLLAKEYNASLFGAKSDGLTLNTTSIQKGIDFISANGGGTLVFYVGRYLTGSVRLKSNVTIKLEEGAVLVGSSSIYDYNSSGSIKAIISADGQENIGISGKGVIEGRSALLQKNMADLKAKGFLLDSLTRQPAMLAFSNCSNIQIDSVNLWDAAATVQAFEKCKNVTIATVNIQAKNSTAPVNVFADNTDVKFINSYVDAPGQLLQWQGAKEQLLIERTTDKLGKLLTQ